MSLRSYSVLVGEGGRLQPSAASAVRADSAALSRAPIELILSVQLKALLFFRSSSLAKIRSVVLSVGLFCIFRSPSSHSTLLLNSSSRSSPTHPPSGVLMRSFRDSGRLAIRSPALGAAGKMPRRVGPTLWLRACGPPAQTSAEDGCGPAAGPPAREAVHGNPALRLRGPVVLVVAAQG